MSVPQKIWFHFIVDSLNRCLYVEDGVVKKSSPPVPLPQLARGWMEMQISFATHVDYWNLNRNYTIPLYFVGDGATIIRDAMWAGKGYEEELFIIILKWNPETGVYDLEYKGKLDIKNASDEPRKGITVNSIQGGVLSYLYANDGNDYEIPLDPANNNAVKQINFDGTNLYDKYRYSVIDINIEKPNDYSHSVIAYTLPFPYISNEGDSSGIISGSQMYEEIYYAGVWVDSNLNSYCQNSANYFFSSVAATTVRVTGTLKFKVNVAFSSSMGIKVIIRTSLLNTVYLLGTSIDYSNYTSTQEVSVNIDQIINIQPNERLFLIVINASASVGTQSIDWRLSDLYVAFNSKVAKSQAYGISIYDLHKQLISKMSKGKYTGESVYFSARQNILFTSTNAIQNFAFNHYYGEIVFEDNAGVYTIKIPGTLQTFPSGNQLVITGTANNNNVFTVKNISGLVAGFTTVTVEEPVITATEAGSISSVPDLKISFKNFFNDVDCLYNIGMKVVDDVVYIEPKATLYDDDSEILDIGEIAGLKLKYASDLLCNVATFGYKSQDYRQRNGVYEFNTTTKYKLPVNSLKKDYTKVMNSRGDCFGIEFIRSNVFNKPTTDNTGDNQPFVVNTKEAQTDVNVTVDFVASTPYGFLLVPSSVSFVVNDVFNITGSANNNQQFTVVGISTFFGSVNIVFVTAANPVVSESAVPVLIDFTQSRSVILLRESYDNITGVLDNTVYNIKDMTPYRMMLAHGNYLRSLLLQLPAEYIEFMAADKNSSLSTTIGGVTLSERQKTLVGSLGDPLFYPWYAEFTTPVPISFSKIMSNVGTGYIKGTFYGVPIYFLPIGKMDAKPAVNAAQQWKLMLAAKNDLATIKNLSLEGLFTTDSMGNSVFTTDLNSLHFNKYNYNLPAKYQHKEMYDDHFHARVENYLSTPYYFQKFQTTENIPVQAITRGLGQLTIEIYDRDGKIVLTDTMTITTDPAVQSPYALQNYTIVTAALNGVYFVVLSYAGTKLRISEYIEIAEKHEKTLLFEATHTTNKFSTYFGSYTPTIRVEATLLQWYWDSSFEPYTDELADVEVLDGIPVGKRILHIGNAYGVPDWMGMKLNKLLLLNRCLIDGVRYSRTTESKFAKKELNAHGMLLYNIEVSKAVNKHGLSTNESGIEEDELTTIVYTLDGKAFGLSDPGAVINVELKNE